MFFDIIFGIETFKWAAMTASLLCELEPVHSVLKTRWLYSLCCINSILISDLQPSSKMMHQTSLRAVAPLRARATRPWASSRAAGSWAVRTLCPSSDRAQVSTTKATLHSRPRNGITSSRTLLSTPIALAYSSDSRPPVKYKIDRKHEKEVGKQKLDVRPDKVTVDSSVRHIIEHGQNPEEPPSVSEALGKDVVSLMMHRSTIQCVQDINTPHRTLSGMQSPSRRCLGRPTLSA